LSDPSSNTAYKIVSKAKLTISASFIIMAITEATTLEAAKGSSVANECEYCNIHPPM
jgi:hypothetical protein